MAKKWYVVNTLSGAESRAKKALDEAIRRALEAKPHLADRFGEILLPEEEVVEVRNGKNRTLKRKKFPGYLFIEVDLEQEDKLEVEVVLRSTPRISGINKDPIPTVEIDRMRGREEEEDEQPKILAHYDIGETVRIVNGAFASMEGEVVEVHASRQKLRVNVSIFGRMTSVDLDFSSVERLD